MKGAMMILSALLLLDGIKQIVAADLILTTNPVTEGDALELMVRSARVIDFCEFNLTGKKPIRIYPGFANGNYEFFGDFENGTCGIRFFKARAENSGPAWVRVVHPKINALYTANATVMVRHRLRFVSYPENFQVFENQLIQLECSAHEMNPSKIEILEGPNVLNRGVTLVTWNKNASVLDDRKMFWCRANFEDGLLNSKETLLTVLYPPRLADEPKKREGKYTFNATLGAPVEIQLNIVANPAPTKCNWSFNGVLVTNITNYHELLNQADPPGCFMCKLIIDNCTNDDLASTISLTVNNNVNSTTFNARLVTNDQQASAAHSVHPHRYAIIISIFILIGYSLLNGP